MTEVEKDERGEPGLQADQAMLDRSWLRIGAGLAVAGQAMVFSFAINLSEIQGWAYVVVHGILMLSAVASLIFLGGDLMRSAWDSAKAGRISIDLLFLMTLSGALGGSLVSTFTHTGSVYYEVIAILIVVHTAGKMIGARSRLAALRAVDQSREKFAWCKRLRDDGSFERVDARAIAPGTRVRVDPGEPIAVDGTIVRGRGYLQEASMTGEWKPVARAEGEAVWAGTYAIDGTLEVEASGGNRRLDTILAEVESARLAPSRLQEQADRLMAWFLPLVVAASVLTFVGWMLVGPWPPALFNAMAVLLVACPCAMGLATPIAVWGGLARLASLGLVARTGDFLDELARVDSVCLDKTGTLSSGQPEVTAWRFESEFAGREDWVRGLVAAAESQLSHPLARALATPKAAGGFVLRARQIEPGRGLRAEVGDAGARTVRVGVGERDLCSVPPAREEASEDKLVYVYIDDRLAARAVISEAWRDGLRECLAELGALGLEVTILSGDPEAERLVQAELNQRGQPAPIVVRAGLSPLAKKEEVLRQVASGRRVLVVGDGVNDAVAMSVAHAAIAMGSGAELAKGSANAIFAGEDFRFLPRAIRLGRSVRRNVRRGLLFAAVYNLAGVILAAFGWLHPIAAALLMVGSSAFVSVLALRGAREPKPTAQADFDEAAGESEVSLGNTQR